MPFRTLALTAVVLVGLTGCSGGSANAVPGSTAASRPPFDATTAYARYVDRCMKDGGTQGRCQCEADDIRTRSGEAGLTRIVTGWETGGSDALQAQIDRRPSMTACGWPKTKL